MTRPRRTTRNRLSVAQLEELTAYMRVLLAYNVRDPDDWSASAFASEDERRRAWREHRDEVVDHYRQRFGVNDGLPWPAYEYDGVERPRPVPGLRRFEEDGDA